MKEKESRTLLFTLDEVQADLYKLFGLFYSGLGIIQRDSPKQAEEKETDAILRLENNVKEIIGQYITTREQLQRNIRRLESIDPAEDALEALVEESRTLDVQLEARTAKMKKDIPLLEEYVKELINLE